MFVVGGLLAFSLTDVHFWDRMETLTDEQALAKDAAAVSRTEIWSVSFDILADHPLGVGPQSNNSSSRQNSLPAK